MNIDKTAPKLLINGFRNIVMATTLTEVLANGNTEQIKWEVKTLDNTTVTVEQKAHNIWLVSTSFQVIGFTTSFHGAMWYFDNAPIYTVEELYTLARG